MRLLKAFVRIGCVDTVARALQKAGAPGITISHVHGVGYDYVPVGRHRVRDTGRTGRQGPQRRRGHSGAPELKAAGGTEAKAVSIMTERAEDRPDEARHGAKCRVCLKPMGASERKWSVHYRGAEYQVCCPSCVQVFNRAPQQFVEEP